MRITLNEAFLEQKVALGERLYKITLKTINQLRNGQFNELRNSMEEREGIIAEIKYLDQVYQDKCDLSSISDPPIQGYISKLKHFFVEVQKMDTEITKMLKVEMNQGVTELHKIKNAQKINKAYNSYTKQGSFFDKQR